MSTTDLNAWLGKSQTVVDRMDPGHAACIAATLSESPYYAQWRGEFLAPKPRVDDFVESMLAFQNSRANRHNK